VRLDPTKRYDMPVVFGSSPTPDVTTMTRVQSVSVPFVTDPVAMAELLPPFFEPAELPVVSVVHTMNRGVDYMGGRGYNIVRVGFAVVFRGEIDTLVAPYAPVMWESDAAPIILGRERGGYAKIFGRVPDLQERERGCRFACYEYDARLLTAEVEDWTPLLGDALAGVRQRASEAVTLGWKYIPGIEDTPDADYPIRQVANYDYARAWTGWGTVSFDTPDATEAPYSAHILAALRQLPVVRYEPATMVQGSMKLPRNDIHRLH
jgi:hypothetical protein